VRHLRLLRLRILRVTWIAWAAVELVDRAVNLASAGGAGPEYPGSDLLGDALGRLRLRRDQGIALGDAPLRVGVGLAELVSCNEYGSVTKPVKSRQ